MSLVSDIVREIIAEANVQRMGRKKLVRARVRGGKVQRRKVLSAVPGYTKWCEDTLHSRSISRCRNEKS